jgi:ribose/xylose/arabinose/galactoside ABC-type transport system permease subunit
MSTEKAEPATRVEPGPGPLAQVGQLLGRYGIVLALVVLCLVLSFLSPYFLTVNNFFNVLLQASINLIVAVGMTFVITSAGIDLSVGSIVAVAGMVMADVMARKWGLPAAVTLALLAGTTAGALNGVLITRLRLPPFIVTLGTMSILRGVALIYNEGKPIYGLAQRELRVVSGDIGPIPIPVIIALVVALLAHLVLRHTTIGEYTTAIGGNEETARLSGINVPRYKIVIYSISGLMCGLAGIILTARLSAAEPIAGVMYELDAIAATVMGGTSLMGGEGTIFGTIIGALLMSVLRNGLNLLNIQSYYQQVIIGSVIILAVAVDKLRKR